MTAKRGLKCRWCAQAQTQHREMVLNPGVFRCADGRVAVFRPVKVGSTKRWSQSYDEHEVALLNAMLDATEARFKSHEAMPKLARKIRAMNERVLSAEQATVDP